MKKFPVNVIWHSCGQDFPVTLVGSYGQYEGQEWFKAESGTGIPADKIIWPKESFIQKVKNYARSFYKRN